jgi:hypothetical protein
MVYGKLATMLVFVYVGIFYVELPMGTGVIVAT